MKAISFLLFLASIGAAIWAVHYTVERMQDATDLMANPAAYIQAHQG